LDNEWPIPFGPISDPPAFGELYLVKYFGSFIYFIPHAIKNRLKNMTTLPGCQKLTIWEKEVLKCREIEPIPRALGLIQWQPT